MRKLLGIILGTTLLMGVGTSKADIVGTTIEALELVDVYCLAKLITGGTCAKCSMVCRGVSFYATSKGIDNSVANSSSANCSKCLCEKMKGNWNETHEKCCPEGHHWIPWDGDKNWHL